LATKKKSNLEASKSETRSSKGVASLQEQRAKESKAMEVYFQNQSSKAEVELKTLQMDFNIKALQFEKLKDDLQSRNIPLPDNLYHF
jgi:hypothetical protein